MPDAASIDKFLARWRNAGANERANYTLYLSELCVDALGVAGPEPAGPATAENNYVFERPVTFHFADGTTSTGRIDLYKRGCFVLEAKQGVSPSPAPAVFSLSAVSAPTAKGIGVRGTDSWAVGLRKAKVQAENYAKHLPDDHGWPPFVIVVDVGYCIELFADFGRSGKQYRPFPDPLHSRIFHDPAHAQGRPTLADPKVLAMLAQVWTAPMALDPASRAAKATREIAGYLAELAKSIENRRIVDGEEVAAYDGELVAMFLMRCLFTMFAEDVGLLPAKSFQTILEKLEHQPHLFASRITAIWQEIDKGVTDSGWFGGKVPHFNGKLFAGAEALPVTLPQLKLLIEAATKDWKEVEPAIFGTLLERALNPKERHKLGAHYTPRAYVERLVLPTVIEPLRAEWSTALAEAMVYETAGRRDGAVKRLVEFHQKLCKVKVLDPACGTGNFLYVTLEHLKRLEGEVLQAIADMQQTDRAALVRLKELSGETVGPWQMHGLEVNPRAAILAEVVLWIGYLQWHFRAVGGIDRLPEPVLGQFTLVERRDAVLAWTERRHKINPETGRPVVQWDGVSFKKHPVTGADVPDDSRTRVVEEFTGLRKAEWPEADYVVGNPPFIGPGPMRATLGDGYTQALRATYATVPESVDFVMYWWDRAAELLRNGKIQRFGFITTNSITQTFSRRVMQAHMEQKPGISLVYAVPDHPWVDSVDGAAVRIAMTVAVAEAGQTGVVHRVIGESPGEEEEVLVEVAPEVGAIHPDLKIGANVTAAVTLRANEGLSARGVQLSGAGFIVTSEQAAALGRDTVPGLAKHIRAYRNGRDLASKSRDVFVLDLFGLNETSLRQQFPTVYQHVREYVWPERSVNARATQRINWWIFGEPRRLLREAQAGLPRYIATIETAKHRVFQFLDAAILPDNMLVNIALDDGYCLGIVSSKIHVCWALAVGGRLGVGNDPRYSKTRCFDTFPFPTANAAQQAVIRQIAEELDAHRKRQLGQHPELTLTKMYNILAALRAGPSLTPAEKTINELGLCGVLRDLHDQLDAAVFAAYGWPHDLDEQQILQRLVDLNAERAAEERSGMIRWLRPEFQDPKARAEVVRQTLDLGDGADEDDGTTAALPPWPKKATEMLAALRAAMALAAAPLSADELARGFAGARLEQVEGLLAAMAAAGVVLELADFRWVLVV